MSTPSADGREAGPAEPLFYEILALPPGERDAYLEQVCPRDRDSALHAEVMGLLQSHEEAGGFLPFETVTAPLFRRPAELLPESPGDQIGPYKLMEQIGEGGFGIVWVAEQEKPVRRRVALKVLKPGMDTKQVIARFEQERQALAMMDHPNIARVLDAGATPHGRPYFVMELVKGLKITQYCDQANLPTQERLRLFIAVCQAVQHAHQKGIIHRDLKPSNILVTLHDGVPVPKVIDFGVAKATQQQRLTDLTLYTQFEQMVGTPLYMSPEQAEMSGLDIDTRSDIYSLGVLLYELLTGRTPFDPATLMKRGLEEIRRAVREQEPQKPSTFVSTLALHLRTDLARHRQTDSAKLVGQIRGDLDWIVMKALEKDRTRRYETATGFAQDIQRHLGSEPVQARPPTMGYRFRRFARRNKAVFAAAAAVLAALVIGLATTTWMFFKEKNARERAVAAEQEQGRLRLLAVAAEQAQTNERKKAESEASKSRKIAVFLKDMLKGVGPSVALGRDTTMLREILDKTAESLGQDLKNQPEVEAELRQSIGEVYWELGELEKCEAMFRGALSLRQNLGAGANRDLADSMQDMAAVLQQQGNLSEAEPLVRGALEISRKLGADGHEVERESLHTLGLLLRDQGDPAGAVAIFREVLEKRKHTPAHEQDWEAVFLHNLAGILTDQGKLAEAEPLYLEALALLKKKGGGESPDVAAALSSVTALRYHQGKYAEAEPMARESLELSKKLLGKEHPEIPSRCQILASILAAQDKFPEAEALFWEEIVLTSKLPYNGLSNTSVLAQRLALLLIDQRKYKEAETMFRDVLALTRRLHGNEHPKALAALFDLAFFLFEQRNDKEAEPLFREHLSLMRKLHGREHKEVAVSLHSLVEVLRRRKKYTEAGDLSRESLEIRRKLFVNGHPAVDVSLHQLAHVYEKQGRLAEAETTFREVLAMPRKVSHGIHPAVVLNRRCLVKMLKGAGKGKEAEAEICILVDAARDLLKSDHPDVFGQVKVVVDYLAGLNEMAEVERLLREALARHRSFPEDDWAKNESDTVKLAEMLYRQRMNPEAETVYRELLEVRREHHGASHPETMMAAASLGRLLADWAWSERTSPPTPRNLKAEVVQRAREAEQILRECLAHRLRGPKTILWRTDDLRSRLGGALTAVVATDPALPGEARLAMLAEAESLLVPADAALQQDHQVEAKYKEASASRLVRLYEAWNQSDKAAGWQKKLDDLKKSQASPGAGAEDQAHDH